MAAPRRSLASAKPSLARLLLAVVAGAAVAIGLAGCAGNPGATQAIDQDGTKHVQEYFAGNGARYVEGLVVKDVQVTNGSAGRRLSLTLVGDGSSRAEASFIGLYYMSTSDHGWLAELNRTGLGLFRVLVEFDYHDGSAPETLEVDVAAHSVAGSTRIRPGPPTTSP